MSGNGAVTGYRPFRTLTYGTEFVRQWRRRRTQLAMGFMVVLPLIVLLAFEIGGDDDGRNGNGRGAFSSLVDVALAGGLNFALFTLFVSSSFLLVVMFALFHGDTVASEAQWGSLRYLLAIPVPRGRLLGIKLAVALTYSLLAVAVLVGTALALGTLRYGWHPLQSGIAADVPAGEGLLRVLGIAGWWCSSSSRASSTRSPRWARCATSCRPTSRAATWACLPRRSSTTAWSRASSPHFVTQRSFGASRLSGSRART
jgi:ABC-2 type transport system permease protein